MIYSTQLSPWAMLANELDPPEPPEELSDPVSLAVANDPKYVVRAHLRVIGEAMKRLEAREYDRLMINQPPQTGKSVTAVEWGAFWFLCKNPTTNIVIGSYDSSLAMRRGKAIRKLVRMYGAKYGLFVEVGSASQTDWRLTAGGGVRSVGVGSGITGHPGDVLFVDDPTKSRADADSLVKRENVWDWYSADLLSRQSPGALVILVQTPWHVDDLRARVLEQEGEHGKGGRWKVVRMPAFADSPDDPLGRADGEPLPHPKLPADNLQVLSEHWHKVKQGEIPRDWFALWQCDPRPMIGTLLSPQQLRDRRCWAAINEHPCSGPGTIAVAIDPSGGGRDVAGIIGGHLGHDSNLYITHDRSSRMPSDAWGRAACELAAEIGADRFVIETNFGADQATFVLRTSWESLRRERPQDFSEFVPRIVTVHAKRGKLLRAEPIAQQWIEGKVWTSTLLADLEHEWQTWQQTDTSSPGRIDASVYLAYSLLPVPTSGASTMSAGQMLAQTDLLSWGTGR